MAKDYADILLKAMQTISESTVSQLSYDKTVICHIIDNSKADEGQYTVTDGSSTFYAYSDNTEYKKSEAVYVSIPQDDFSKTKLIVGKYIADEDTNQYRYKAPWERFVDMTNNLIPVSNTKEFKIKANGSVTKKTIAIIPVSNGTQYTRMGLKADFKTLLSAYNVMRGTFGIGLNITYEIQLTSQTPPITKKVNINYTSDEMYGNPYKYDVYYSQEAVFDITKLDNIKEIEVFLYQEKDFYNKSGDYISSDGLDNIFVKNIEISLGYDALDFTEDTIILYTTNNKTYTVNATNNKKTLYARWVHVLDADSRDVRCYEDFSRINGGIEIRWYQYLLADDVCDEWAGNFWQRISGANDFSLEIDPDITLNEDKFKVMIHPFDTDEIYESNILVFTNENPVADKATVDLIRALKITFEENEPQGEYLLYDQTNKIQDSMQANKLRKLIATYNSLITGETSLDGAESIQWRIPLTNTMIQRPQEGKEFDSENDIVEFTSDGLYCIITRDASLQNGTIGQLFNNYAEQCFRIKEYYSENATNNTIYCNIIKNKISYTAEVQLFFGPKGTNGTDYTFLLKFEQGRNCLYHYTGRTVNGVQEQDLDPLKISAVLYDNTNNLVSGIDTPIPKFTWYSSDGEIVFCDQMGTELQEQTLYQAGAQISDGSHLDIYIRRKNENSICQYNILKAEISIDIDIGGQTKKGVVLEAYLPIPFAYQYGYSIEGTTEIIYDTFGKCDYYYKNPYVLYYDNVPVTDNALTWTTNHDDVAAAANYYPKMGVGKTKVTYTGDQSVEVTGGQLIPPSMLFEQISKKINVVASISGTDYWIQPIIMRRNVYSSQMLNSWNGDLTIDENNGTILATMLGAGFKDSANRFNGVLMGDVSDQAHRGTAADAHAGTGLFGYHEGAQSFGFKIDGTAFIGKSGKGRIEFDGNSGRIQSMSYSQDKTGMMIDLDDGIINILGATKAGNNNSSETPVYTQTNSQVKISALTPYMLIKENNKTVFQIDTTTSFIQTNDYDVSTSNGARITLKGASDTNNSTKPSFELRAFSSDGRIKLSSISPFFVVSKTVNNAYKDLIHIAANSYYLQSADYDTTAETGTYINLSQGKINSYSFDLKAINPSIGTIYLSSTDNTYPFRIVSANNSYFRINWNASFEAASSRGKNVKFKFDSINGTLDVKNGDISGGTIDIGNGFFYADDSNVDLGDWHVDSGTRDSLYYGNWSSSVVGMSGGRVGHGLYLWAGWGHGASGSDAVFGVGQNGIMASNITAYGVTVINSIHGTSHYANQALGSVLDSIYDSIVNYNSWLIRTSYEKNTLSHDIVCEDPNHHDLPD